jgi:dinuclear metal center YbgI/SA1388 family protein
MVADVGREQLTHWLNNVLVPDRFSDYCPNGLQVEGRERISKVVTGVTASLALIEAAIEQGADTVLVHHGWFWRGEDPTVRGQRKKRLARLLANDINLFAYHLPLDAHPTFGNNAQLGLRLGLTVDRNPDGSVVTAGSNGLIWFGRPSAACTLAELTDSVSRALGRDPVVIGDPTQPCTRVAWCTGAAQGMFEQAIQAGADVYITGEISEPNMHLAHEMGVAFISAGHHATERYGIQALGEALAQALGVNVTFIDLENPA